MRGEQQPSPVRKLVVLQGDGEVPNAVAVGVIDETLLPCSKQWQRSRQISSTGALSKQLEADVMPDASHGLHMDAKHAAARRSNATRKPDIHMMPSWLDRHAGAHTVMARWT